MSPLYTYVRYLNQLASDSTYTYKSTGQTIDMDRRQEIQLLKVQIKFLGWLFDPKFRYFLYAWSSNASQGQGAQVVLAGNLNYNFNDYFTLGGGITSLPGVRSTEGNFPFWLNVDNRMLADEFMRPSYTSGVWVEGQYHTGTALPGHAGQQPEHPGGELGAARSQAQHGGDGAGLDAHDEGIWPGIWRFRESPGGRHALRRCTTRTAPKTSRASPTRTAFENTQIRLADGTVVFTPNLFGPGITVTDLRYQMADLDAGIKYHGMALEGEYYWRKLDQFEGPGTAGVANQYNQGFQLQASMMAIDRTPAAVCRGIEGPGRRVRRPWDTRLGVNFFPLNNRVLRWNTQAMYLYKSPVGYTSLTYNVGSTGWIFNTDFEMAL